VVGALKDDQHPGEGPGTRRFMNYKAGLRTGGGVAAMAEVAYPLSEDDISALAHLFLGSE